MRESELTIKGITAALLSVIGHLLDSIGILCIVFAALMMLDFVTGILAAKISGVEIKSKTGLQGVLKKCMYICIVVAAFLFDLVILFSAHELGFQMPVSSIFGVVVTCWFIANELISILENLSKADVRAPTFFQAAVKRFLNHVDDVGNGLVTEEKKQNGDEQDD